MTLFFSDLALLTKWLSYNHLQGLKYYLKYSRLTFKWFFTWIRYPYPYTNHNKFSKLAWSGKWTQDLSVYFRLLNHWATIAPLIIEICEQFCEYLCALSDLIVLFAWWDWCWVKLAAFLITLQFAEFVVTYSFEK